MKRLAALLIMTFSMNVLAFEASEEITHALEHAGVITHQTVSSSDKTHANSEGLQSTAAGDAKSDHSTPQDSHCAHAANCCYVLRAAPSFVDSNLSRSTTVVIEAALASVTLEGPTRPPLA